MIKETAAVSRKMFLFLILTQQGNVTNYTVSNTLLVYKEICMFTCCGIK